MTRKGLIAAATIGVGLLLAPSAMAATRFAAPGGTGVEPCTSPVAPCSIFRAADASSGAALGDEVILAPGEYSDTADDLGPTGIVSFEPGISVHGAFGSPRPLIRLENTPSTTAITMTDGDTVSHLEIVTDVAIRTIAVTGGILEDAIVRSNTDGNGAFACRHTGGLIRNTACVSSGDAANAIGGATFGTATLRLRSVTAVSTGPNGAGLNYQGSGSTDLTVDASSVIAAAAGLDVKVFLPVPSGKIRIDLDHSSYTDLSNPELITDPRANANVGATARLAADGIHQLPDSPTIDRGVVDQFSGALDIDGDLRSIGAAPDIGADELVPTPLAPVAQQPGSGGGPIRQPILLAPETRLGRHPARKTAGRAAAFFFSSDQMDASFQCKLDGQAFKRCSSPYRATVEPGRHSFRVRAVDALGVADPTPAAFSWKVARAPR